MVEEVLERMQIMHRRDHFPQQLSGGQQQRVAVSRAVVAKPALILADEPTGNLDSANGEEVMNSLTQLNEGGTTIVMVTHSPHDSEFAHRIIHLFDGHVVTENYKEKCVTLNFRFRITFAIRAFWLPEVEMLQVNNPGRARPLAWEH